MTCRRCKELREIEPLVKGGVISEKWAFHLQDTHGIWREFLPYMIKEILERKKNE